MKIDALEDYGLATIKLLVRMEISNVGHGCKFLDENPENNTMVLMWFGC